MPGGRPLQKSIFNPKAPILNTAPVLRWLIAACVIAHLLQIALPYGLRGQVFDRFAFYSIRYTVLDLWKTDLLATFSAPLTYMFIHGGFLHLFMNMAMLLAFGTPIARRMSNISFLILYTLCGISGLLLWVYLYPVSTSPLVGASGAISGMVGAISRLAIVNSPARDIPFRNRETALGFAAIWLVLNCVFGIFGGALFGLDGEIAWEVHLGGFIAGFLLMPLFARPPRPDWPE